MNGHKPLVRAQFKEFMTQKDHFTQKERKDMEKLEVALQYIKELNRQVTIELDQSEKAIRAKLDEKANTIGEQYKLHLMKAQQEIDDQYKRKMELIKQLQVRS